MLRKGGRNQLPCFLKPNLNCVGERECGCLGGFFIENQPTLVKGLRRRKSGKISVEEGDTKSDLQVNLENNLEVSKGCSRKVF